MPLTDDELNTIETIAYACDGESFAYFEKRLGGLATLDEGSLLALAGRFLHGHMSKHARFVADYAGEKRRGGTKTPQEFLAAVREREREAELCPPPNPRG